uniref:Integrase core domain containing protein n=1 Tax=Solanum tuberosum TaxID=4113 RepID=M1DTZ1_SOLTU
MNKSKVMERIKPAQEKSVGSVINEETATSKDKATKLTTTIGKGKDKRPTSSRKAITMDPNIPSWARGFFRAVHIFLAETHSTDLSESGPVVPPEATSSTDAQIQSETSGPDAPADGATA